MYIPLSIHNLIAAYIQSLHAGRLTLYTSVMLLDIRFTLYDFTVTVVWFLLLFVLFYCRCSLKVRLCGIKDVCECVKLINFLYKH